VPCRIVTVCLWVGPLRWPSLHPGAVAHGDGSPPNFILNVSDLQQILFGFEGERYTDSPVNLNPSDCP
jgi:hypothetical protein